MEQTETDEIKSCILIVSDVLKNKNLFEAMSVISKMRIKTTWSDRKK